jgi:hypothetical protein
MNKNIRATHKIGDGVLEKFGTCYLAKKRTDYNIKEFHYKQGNKESKILAFKKARNYLKNNELPIDISNIIGYNKEKIN